MPSLSEAIGRWEERKGKDSSHVVDVMAVVTCRRDESSSLMNTRNGRYRRMDLADQQSRASLRLSDSISFASMPTEGSVITLFGVTIMQGAHDVELRQDGRTHEGPLWQIMLPHNATGEQRQENQQAAALWVWWQQQNVKALSEPKCVDRTLGEMALTAGMKGNIVAHVCQVQVCHPKRVNKRRFGRTQPHIIALLTDAARKTFVSLLDKTGALLQKLQRAHQTQELIRITSVQSTTSDGEEVVLVATHDTQIHPVATTNSHHLFSPESQAFLSQMPSSSPTDVRSIISPLYRINKSRTVPYLTPGREAVLEIEGESVLANYFTVFDVLSCGGDLLLLQALIDEAIPLRWTIRNDGVVSQVSLVGFPLNVKDT
ncbi:hypothetical protein FisN_6Hh447 [Fistulifera solaris]|uniref:Uncharacterized protein n=1 Tax=Fistulifera solaris TaxID=1519565 RepID=A0A1Z5K5T1_FISSO|nr:hypothetical protein FisN_6Hh447 [Fistulifera solaris]|eukprot:GAX21555.1 hypothetical protein FisN_6Hh447 [Fistulifera solaris]